MEEEDVAAEPVAVPELEPVRPEVAVPEEPEEPEEPERELPEALAVGELLLVTATATVEELSAEMIKVLTGPVPLFP